MESSRSFSAIRWLLGLTVVKWNHNGMVMKTERHFFRWGRPPSLPASFPRGKWSHLERHLDQGLLAEKPRDGTVSACFGRWGSIIFQHHFPDLFWWIEGSRFWTNGVIALLVGISLLFFSFLPPSFPPSLLPSLPTPSLPLSFPPFLPSFCLLHSETHLFFCIVDLQSLNIPLCMTGPGILP